MPGPTWAWQAGAPAAESDLNRLIELSPIDLPPSYLALLRRANGYEAALAVQPLWLVLYPAEEVVQIAESGTFKEHFPFFFVIGGSGGGEVIGLDTRPERLGTVVTFDQANTNLEQSVWDIAPTFDDLLPKIEN